VSLTEDLQKFFSRTWLERRLFVESYILLGVMRAAILLLPFRRISGLMGLVQGEVNNATVKSLTPVPAEISWAIQAAAARTPWESACLAQSLAGLAMLSRRGIGATLYLGVAKDLINLEFIVAHAWLCCGDAIITGGAGSDNYIPISSFTRKPTV
jgi:Transglutaminase-like superfamily